MLILAVRLPDAVVITADLRALRGKKALKAVVWLARPLPRHVRRAYTQLGLRFHPGSPVKEIQPGPGYNHRD